MDDDAEHVDVDRPRPPPLHTFIVFALILGAGIWVAQSKWSGGAFFSAVGTWLVFLLLILAVYDTVAMVFKRLPYLSWLPRHPVGGWFEPLRSSFIVISFFYGILVGHYFWS